MTTLDTRSSNATLDGFMLVPPAADDDRPADPLKPTLVAYHLPVAHLAPRSYSAPRSSELIEEDGEVFRAGQRVSPGCYQEIDGPRCIELREEEMLPASCDGRRALYRRVERAWQHFFNSNRQIEIIT